MRGLLAALGWALAATAAVAQDGNSLDRLRLLMERRTAAEVIDARSATPERAALLQAGEDALARGDTEAALQAFERAAMLLHAADTEMSLVRAYLQAGDYQRALNFCAHTAGAHKESAAPVALYAWLLRAGGQEAHARLLLRNAAIRAPDDAVVSATLREFDAAVPVARGVLLGLPHRMAPPALPAAGQAVPAGATVRASGMLVDEGRRALVPLDALRGDTTLWVRNGLGETRAAVLEQREDTLGLAVMRLQMPLSGPLPALAARDPFAGSPGFAVVYAAGVEAAPAWPWLYPGFLGALDTAVTPVRALGIGLPAGARGGPVFDAAGQLAGVGLKGPGGDDRMLPVSAWRQLAGVSVPAGSQVPTRRMPADEVYQRALRVTLQVIAAP